MIISARGDFASLTILERSEKRTAYSSENSFIYNTSLGNNSAYLLSLLVLLRSRSFIGQNVTWHTFCLPPSIFPCVCAGEEWVYECLCLFVFQIQESFQYIPLSPCQKSWSASCLTTSPLLVMHSHARIENGIWSESTTPSLNSCRVAKY